MFKSVLAITFAAVTCFSLAAKAQTNVVSGQASQVAPKTSVSSSEFRRLALIARFFDYEASRLAMERSRRSAIKAYAQTLVNEFRPDFSRLVAGATLFSSLPTSLPSDLNAPIKPFVDDRRAQMLTQLAGAEGRDFDKLYVDMQAGVQQESLALYATYIQSGDDASLLAFAREKLPQIQRSYQSIARLAR